MAEKTTKETLKYKGLGDMPHNLEAEQALLGCLILDPRIQHEVASFLKDIRKDYKEKKAMLDEVYLAWMELNEEVSESE